MDSEKEISQSHRERKIKILVEASQENINADENKKEQKNIDNLVDNHEIKLFF